MLPVPWPVKLAGSRLRSAEPVFGEARWCQPYHFRPPLDDGVSTRKARQVVLKEIRLTRDSERRLSLAAGLPVHTPAVVLDPDSDDVVYLEMVGPQAGRARQLGGAGGVAVCRYLWTEPEVDFFLAALSSSAPPAGGRFWLPLYETMVTTIILHTIICTPVTAKKKSASRKQQLETLATSYNAQSAGSFCSTARGELEK